MRHRSSTSAGSSCESRFSAAYDAAYADVLRYVQRRVTTGAEDVVAEAMTVAWRRVEELPESLDDARAWMFGIAHHCMLNHHRARRRQEALGVRLATAGSATPDEPDGSALAISRLDLARAWALLEPAEQEVIALTALDGLTSEHAGRVLDITATAYRHRLSRARAALRRHLDGAAATAPIREEITS
ncbi:RNA polymerase sigma factor [uncultured Arsenicicoccus sp.]|uniref:RNA polymerase sigma factor n=1 Tax=uncultured Arsenicicoccus sp. TaxID=491339 RepID=UPI0025922C80|nr:sigma-70 family RNA polymerase sigma factor [uncultured Arsenicicoccus sp.]